VLLLDKMKFILPYLVDHYHFDIVNFNILHFLKI